MKKRVLFLSFLLLFPLICKSNPEKEEKKTDETENEIRLDKKALSLDGLLDKIKNDQIKDRAEFQKREARFLRERNQQRTLLRQAQRELYKEEALTKSLQLEFEKQDKELSQLEEKLALTMGDLGEMFGVVKQTARKTKALFENSVISAQYPDRLSFIEKIQAKKNLPDTKQLEKLWFLIQQEMTESGKITRFKQEVIKKNGKINPQEILRVGSFNLVSSGKYLVFDNETGKTLELIKQPKSRYLSYAKKLQKSSKKDKVLPFGLDPSRGSLLSLLIQTPGFFERISQGGIIGYFILFLFLVGLVLSGKQYQALREKEKLLKEQIGSSEILKDNPLGEIMTEFVNLSSSKFENLELKMEEKIQEKTMELRHGLSTIKLLFTVSPLLGLLGTVIGMIATFQSITLFGTGDPKLMAGGISQALITTALGLVSAIPLIFIYNFLSSKANKIIEVFENQALGILSKKYNKSD